MVVLKIWRKDCSMKTFTSLFICLLLSAGFLQIAPQAHAVPWTLPQTIKPTTKTTRVSKPNVAFSFTLTPRQFMINARGFRNIAYTITYKRTGSTQTEALTGGGKVSNGAYVKRHYAGSQSSRYFIPHNVQSGTLQFEGITQTGSNYTLTRSFVIKRGKLVYTN